MVPAPGTEPAGCGPPQVLVVAVGIRLICIRMYIFPCSSFEECPLLSAKVKDSRTMRGSVSLGVKGVSISQQNDRML